MSQQALQKIEAGSTKVTIEKAHRIAQSLGMDVESLLNFQPNNYLNNCTQSGVINTNHLFPEKVLEKLEQQTKLYERLLEGKDKIIEEKDKLIALLQEKIKP